MYIRELTRGDIPAVTAIVHRTFSKDDELARWLYPNLEIYFDDVRRYQVIRIRKRFVQMGSHGFVVVTEPEDEEWTGKSEVVGFAFYVREGKDENAEKWMDRSIINKLERYLLSWELWYEAKFLDRASNSRRMRSWSEAEDATTYPAIGNFLHLGLLSVSPQFQRRGIGAKLVKHGQELAAQDNVPVTLEPSMAGRRLYLKSGFKMVRRVKVTEGLEAATMVWEPEHLKGRWLEDIDNENARLK